jgi:hypothetical protein
MQLPICICMKLPFNEAAAPPAPLEAALELAASPALELAVSLVLVLVLVLVVVVVLMLAASITTCDPHPAIDTHPKKRSARVIVVSRDNDR